MTRNRVSRERNRKIYKLPKKRSMNAKEIENIRVLANIRVIKD